VAVQFGDITALIGKNDAGKSAIMDALSIFFEESKPDVDDACNSGDKSDLCVACEFSDLPDELVLDATNTTTLESEYLLNDSGNLEIHKVFNGGLKSPKLTGTFAYAVHPSHSSASDLLSLKRTELATRAEQLSIDLSNVDRRKSALVRKAIWGGIEDLQFDSRLIPLDSEDAKKIWEQLKRELPAFSLFKSDRPSTDQDPEAQDPMKAAVEEALKDKEAELQAITEHVQREVEDIARRTVEKIREMDPDLAQELKPIFTPPSWKNVFKITLTDDDQVSINKRGSGVRRLILLNFFRAKAERQLSHDSQASIIYAIEEPETSQHPNNQKMLVDALEDLSEESGRQVIISTHTPVLGRILPSHTLRYIEIGTDKKRIVHSGDDNTMSLVANALGVLADHDVKLFIGVEGRHDINFLRQISSIIHETDPSVPNLAQLEDSGKIIFFPMGGANVALWASRARHLNKHEFYIQDSDLSEEGRSVHQDSIDRTNSLDNCTGRLLAKRELENYLHPDAIRAVRPECTVEFGDYDDVPELVAEAIHEHSESGIEWGDLAREKQAKKISQAKRWLNLDAVNHMTHEMLNQRDVDGEIIRILREMQGLFDD